MLETKSTQKIITFWRFYWLLTILSIEAFNNIEYWVYNNIKYNNYNKYIALNDWP